jgi:hypothetical protein
VSCPFSLSRLIKVTDTGQVVQKAEKQACRAFPDPNGDGIGSGPKRNFQVLGPLDFVAEFTQHLHWFRNPGKKTVQWERIPIAGDSGENWWLGHWIGDFDGGGDVDVVSGHCADTYAYWFENLQSDGRTWRRHRLDIHGDKWRDHIRSHDFNGDGRDDLIIQKYHGSGVHYLEAPADPAGSWASWRCWSWPTSAQVMRKG